MFGTSGRKVLGVYCALSPWVGELLGTSCVPGTVLGSAEVMVADKNVAVFALRALMVPGEWGGQEGTPSGGMA